VPIERVIAERYIKLRGNIERDGPCPLCGGDDRFAINVRKQKWICRGCRMGGSDAISLVQFLYACNCREALEILAGERQSRAGNQHGATEHPSADAGADDYERHQSEKANWLWRQRRPVEGTPSERYLRQVRAYRGPFPSTLAFLPPTKPDYHPALIVAYGLPDEPEPGVLGLQDAAVNAVHLVLLKADGSDKADVKKPKITIASPAGMPMVLAPMNDLLGVAITEGVEDALTINAATGLGAWAAGGAGFMPKLMIAIEDWAKREYDASPECVTIFAHADPAGQSGARELADALVARGVEVRIEGIVS
jgi:hypothetical protein